MIASRRDFLAGSAAGMMHRFSASAEEPAEIVPLWEGGPPGGGPAPGTVERVDDQLDTAGLRYRVASHVVRPTLSRFPPGRPTGAAMLIIPGGGYTRVGIDREGYESARWLASIGIAAFVLRYRLPGDGWAAGPDAPLQDAQRAMRLIRWHGPKWQVDPARVGVMGFSAGGHLAGRLTTQPTRTTYPAMDPADRQLARPDAAALFYPVISLAASTHNGTGRALLGENPDAATVAAFSVDVDVPGTTPPIFLCHGQDDRVVAVDQSLRMFTAVRAAGGLVEMHLFQQGMHGQGLRYDPTLPIAAWPGLLESWWRSTGLIKLPI